MYSSSGTELIQRQGCDEYPEKGGGFLNKFRRGLFTSLPVFFFIVAPSRPTLPGWQLHTTVWSLHVLSTAVPSTRSWGASIVRSRLKNSASVRQLQWVGYMYSSPEIEVR